jgi:hypothetical protein
VRVLERGEVGSGRSDAQPSRKLPPATDPRRRSRPVGVEDFDGDGLADVIVLTFGRPHVDCFRNLGGLRFRDATRSSGLETFAGDGSGVAVADFDRDGRIDVYLASLSRGARCRYRGNGDGTFADVANARGGS